jgi:hypothetical protein
VPSANEIEVIVRRSVGEIRTWSPFLISSRPKLSSSSNNAGSEVRLTPRSQRSLKTDRGLNVSGNDMVASRRQLSPSFEPSLKRICFTGLSILACAAMHCLLLEKTWFLSTSEV